MKMINHILNLFYDRGLSLREIGTTNENLRYENDKLTKLKIEQAHVITYLRQRHAKLVEENDKLKSFVEIKDKLIDAKESKYLELKNCCTEQEETIKQHKESLSDGRAFLSEMIALIEKSDIGFFLNDCTLNKFEIIKGAFTVQCERKTQMAADYIRLESELEKRDNEIFNRDKAFEELKIGMAKAVQDKDTEWRKHYEELEERYDDVDNNFRRFLKSRRLTSQYLNYKPRVKK